MDNEYITYREEINGHLEYFILQKTFPHYKCRITKIPITNIFEPVAISKYNLWVVFAGTIQGNMLPVTNEFEKLVLITMQDMATWFLENRIEKDLKRFKKWLILSVRKTA